MTAHDAEATLARRDEKDAQADDAATIVPDADTKAHRRLVWKVDLLLMPFLFVTFGLQVYDKAALGSAAAFGILKDLHLSTTHNGKTVTTRYATAVACFYYGYIVAVLPMALLFARLNLKYATAAVVILWGVVAMLTVAVTDHKGLYVQRVFLGLLESAVSPCFVAITALWYKPSEQAARLGIWYSSVGIFSMFNGAVNYGMGSIGGPSPWKYIFYFCGGLTILWGILIALFLPASPLSPGPLFSASEKAILVQRFNANPFGRDRRPFLSSQARETLTDIRTWIYFTIAALVYLCNGAITGFGPLIIKSMGYTGLQSVALSIPGGAMTSVTIWIFAWAADRWKGGLTWLLPISTLPVLLGAIVIWAAPWVPTAGPLIGYYFIAAFGSPYVLLLTLASANTAGSTKKAMTTGAIFVGYNVGNIAAAYTVRTEEAGKKYRSTWITIIVAMCAASALSLVLRWLYVRENARREGEGVQGLVLKELEEYEDLTDREIRGFRYRL